MDPSNFVYVCKRYYEYKLGTSNVDQNPSYNGSRIYEPTQHTYVAIRVIYVYHYAA
jgi:hypothetical protein